MSTPPAGNANTIDISALYSLNNSGDITSDGTGLMRSLYTKLGKATAVNLNATGDTSVTIWSSKYIITQVIMRDASATPAVTLTFTVRDTAAGGGNSLIGSVTALNTVVSTSIAGFLQPSPTALMSSRQLTTSTLFINVSVPNGSALTANFDIIGIILN